MTSFHGLPSKTPPQFLSPPPAYACPLSCLSLSPCPFMHPLFCLSLASTSIQPSFSSLRFSSFWSKRRGSSVLRLVLPKAPGVCSNTGAEGLLLGALRCALIASHSTSAVWERVAMATQSFALLYLRVLFAVRSQE